MYLISEKKRRQSKNKYKNSAGITFVPNYFENPVDTPAMGDTPFASLDCSQPTSEDLMDDEYFTYNGATEIHMLNIGHEIGEALDNLMEKEGSSMVIINPGKKHLAKFDAYERLYGNCVILKKK